MSPATTAQVLAATRQWLKPVIHVLLRCGIPWREFAELAKSTYVDVATRQFGKRGRPTNVSRTAVLTGLPRRDVRKQRQKLESGPEPLAGYVSKASLVLSAWHLDKDFLSGKGKPIALPLEGESVSFATLCGRCGAGDVPASTLLKELVSAGAVRQRTDGKLEALQRNYIPQEMDASLIRLWGSVLADVANTYAHNLMRKANVPARFERAAVNDRIDPKALEEFKAFLEAEGQAFLERADAWLAAHEVRKVRGQPSSDPVRVGVGMYHLQD